MFLIGGEKEGQVGPGDTGSSSAAIRGVVPTSTSLGRIQRAALFVLYHLSGVCMNTTMNEWMDVWMDE